MKVAIRHGAVVKCDMPGCPERFTTYSMSGKARGQAANEGWSRIKGKSITDSEGNTLAMGARKVDICPSCKPVPVMSQSDEARRP